MVICSLHAATLVWKLRKYNSMDMIWFVPVSLSGREGSWEQKIFVDPDSLTVRKILQCMQKQYFSLNRFVVADITLCILT